jgi:hypothetical protein
MECVNGVTYSKNYVTFISIKVITFVQALALKSTIMFT